MLPKKTSLAIATFGVLVLLLESGQIGPPVYARRSRGFPAARHTRDVNRFAPIAASIRAVDCQTETTRFSSPI